MIRAMPHVSPAGHQIEIVSGSPDAIKKRGEQISQLASDMNKSSALLRALVDNGAEMEGQAIDKLRELSKEVYDDLGKGGELYAAVAPYIKAYGQDLDSAQKSMTTIVGDLYDLWEEYVRKADAADAARSERPDYPTGEQADDPALREKAEQARDEAAGAANGVANGAKEAWDARARDYDAEWDSWHAAFTHAANGIRDDMVGKIEDGFWDDVDGFLQFMSDFLAVAGIVLAVLAVVIGGPIIAALAAIVAVATLLVAVGRLIRGKGTVLDVVFGVIGVLPLVGPAIRMFKGPAAELARMGLSKADFVSYAANIKANPANLLQLRGGPSQVIADATSRFFTGGAASAPLVPTTTMAQGFEAAATPFAAMFSIAGGIKDTVGGAWAGTFNPHQNVFS